MGGIGIILSFLIITAAVFVKKLFLEGDFLDAITEFLPELLIKKGILEDKIILPIESIAPSAQEMEITNLNEVFQQFSKENIIFNKNQTNLELINEVSNNFYSRITDNPLNLSLKEISFLGYILKAFLIKNIQFGNGWIYLVTIASFLVGILDDLNKIWNFDNKGLGKLDKFWMMLASIGSIILIKFGYWIEGCLFFTYLIAVAFSILSKDWVLNRFYAIGIALCWIIFSTIEHSRIFGTLLLFLPLGCSIMSFGLLNFASGKIKIIHLMLAIFLGISSNQSSPKKVMALLICLLSEPIFHLFFGTQISLQLFMPIVLTLIIIFSSAIFDLTDGLDGLLAIIASISFITLGFIFPNVNILPNLIGAVLGFAILNLRPAAIFMGDCGSLALGSIFGAIMIALWLGDFGTAIPAIELIYLGIALNLVTLVNFISVAFNITLAKFRLPRFFFAPIHHELERRFSEETATYFLWLITILCSLVLLFNKGFRLVNLFSTYLL